MIKSKSRRKAIGLIALSPFAIAHCTNFRPGHSKDPSLKILSVPAVHRYDRKACLPYAIKGICEYYELDKSLREINRGLNRRYGEVSYVLDGARLLSEFQLNVDFYYFQNQLTGSYNIYESKEGITKNQIPVNVKAYNRHLSLETITSEIDKGNPSIIFVDGYVLKNRPKNGIYLGHYVTVIGYDKNNIYLNDTLKLSTRRKIENRLFQKARLDIPWQYGMILSRKHT